MTRSSVDQPRMATNNLDLDDTLDTLPIPIIDTTDGYGTGLRLTEAIETLANEAEEIGVPHDSDGVYQIGDSQGDHLIIEQEIVDTKDDEPTGVINTLVIAAPSKSAYFRFQSRVQNGIIKFCVNEETPGLSRQGEFSGKSGTELPADVVKPTQDFTETMIMVTDALCREGKISEDAREGVVEHLAIPEAARHDQPTKIIGSAALSKLLTNIGLYRSVA